MVKDQASSTSCRAFSKASRERTEAFFQIAAIAYRAIRAFLRKSSTKREDGRPMGFPFELVTLVIEKPTSLILMVE
jgi:hypothetical protein